MKYSIPGDYVYTQDGSERALIVAEGDEFPFKELALLVGGLLIVEVIVMHIAKKAFIAGAKAYNIGAFNALNSLGLVGSTENDMD